MSRRQRCFLVVLCLYVTFALVTCEQKPPILKGGSPTAVVPIALDVDSAGNCTQNGVEGGNVVMGSPGVSWSNPSGYSVAVGFAAGCGFANCTPPSGTSVSSGASSKVAGNAVGYTSITINNQPCTVGSAGLIMR